MPLRRSRRWFTAPLAMLLVGSPAVWAQEPAPADSAPALAPPPRASVSKSGSTDVLDLDSPTGAEPATPSSEPAPGHPGRKKRKRKREGAPSRRSEPESREAPADGGAAAGALTAPDLGVDAGEAPRPLELAVDAGARSLAQDELAPEIRGPGWVDAGPVESSPAKAGSGPIAEAYPAWSTVTAVGLGDGDQAVSVDVGVPGITARYLWGMGRWIDLGAGLEADFPPLNATDQGLPGGALHVMGDLHLKLARFGVGSFMIRADPEWIFGFGGVSLLYAPVTLVLGVDLEWLHLALEGGVAPYTAGASIAIPFDLGGVSPPFVGVAVEAPVNSRLSLVVRVRLQTFLWTSNLFADDGTPSIYFFGGISLGAAWRF